MWNRDTEILKNYTYAGRDDSILLNSRTLAYWTYVESTIPRWVAPNTITVVGFLAMCLCLGLVVWKDRRLKGENWVLTLYISASMWFYSTMDCVDGMHARAHQMGTPLGQLFDHGVDSLVCTINMFCFASGIGLQDMRVFVLLMLTAQTIFYWVTAKEFYAKYFYIGIIGPTELILLESVLLMGIALGGPKRMLFFKKHHQKKMARCVGAGAVCVAGIALGYFLGKIAFVHRFRFDKVASHYTRIRILLPHFLFLAQQATILRTLALSGPPLKSAWTMLPATGIWTFSFSLFTIFTIYSHQLRMEYAGYPIFLPFLVVCTHQVFKYFTSKLLVKTLWILFGMAFVNYAYHILNIIWEITTALGIRVFVVPPPMP